MAVLVQPEYAAGSFNFAREEVSILLRQVCFGVFSDTAVVKPGLDCLPWMRPNGCEGRIDSKRLSFLPREERPNV